MSSNKFLSSIVYGRLAITDYHYATSISGSISCLVYVTISSPIYQTISNNIYYSISSLVYKTISSNFNNTLSSIVYSIDSSGNQISSINYYNFSGSNTSNVLNGYVWNTYLLKTVSNNIITGYTYNTSAYSTNNVKKAFFYNSGNTLLGGDLFVKGIVKTT